jgi:hypothetical protein
MGKLINKIKAIAKILVGVIVASFLGSLITLFVVIITGAGALGLALGIVVMTGAAALGAVIGSRWAKNNITDYENAKKIAIWSALLFLVTNLLISAAGNILSSFVGTPKTDFWIQAAQIIAQSFVIYAASQCVMSRLIKKENQE